MSVEQEESVGFYLFLRYPNSELLTEDAAAKELLVCTSTVKQYIKSGELASLSVEDLAAFIVKKY